MTPETEITRVTTHANIDIEMKELRMHSVILIKTHYNCNWYSCSWQWYNMYNHVVKGMVQDPDIQESHFYQDPWHSSGIDLNSYHLDARIMFKTMRLVKNKWSSVDLKLYWHLLVSKIFHRKKHFDLLKHRSPVLFNILPYSNGYQANCFESRRSLPFLKK